MKHEINTLPVYRLYESLNNWVMRFPDGDPDLWNVQNEALLGLRNVIPQEANKEVYNFIFHMFMGTGKTRLAVKIIELMTQSGNGTVPKTIIRAPTRFLVRQIAEEIKFFAPQLADQVGLYYYDKREPYKQIVVTTFQGFSKGISEGLFDPREVQLSITDETHEALSERRIADANRFPQAVRIGLTATPEYSYDRTALAHYRLAYKIDHLEAVDKGVIAPFRNIIIQSDVNLDDVDIEKDGEYDLIQLERTINNKARNESAIKFYRDFVEPTTGQPILGKQALAFCVDINHAKDFSALANEAIQKYMKPGAVFCEAVWGGHPELESILERYKCGEILCLANADLLVRGFNHPRASICLNLAPSRSSVVVGQRAGRVLRKDIDKEFALVVDIVDEVMNPDKMPLLYGEYVGGAAFGTVFSDEASVQSPSIDGDDTDEKPSISIKKVMVTKDEVMAYLADRKFRKEEMLRNGVIQDTVLPALRQKMNENGLHHLYQLWNKIKDQLPSKNEERAFDDYTPTYDRFCRICSGVTSAWNLQKSTESFSVPTIEGLVIAAYFKMGDHGVKNLFGPLKGRLLGATKTEQPYNREQHERFARAMDAAGYSGYGGLSKLHRALILNKKTGITYLSNLSRGQISPIQKSTGTYSSVAQEVALLLNMTEEELFDCNPKLPDWSPDVDASAQLFEDEENLDLDLDLNSDNATPVLQLGQAFRGVGDIESEVVEYSGVWLSLDEKTTSFENNQQDTAELKQQVSDVLDTLSSREEKVVRMRFGIDMASDHALDDVAKRFDLNSEQIRQIEAKAIRKLRQPSRSDSLRTFLFGGNYKFPETTNTKSLLSLPSIKLSSRSIWLTHRFFGQLSSMARIYVSCGNNSKDTMYRRNFKRDLENMCASSYSVSFILKGGGSW